MAIYKCKMCGGDLAPLDNSGVCECVYCGTTQTVPTINNEKINNLFNRANQLRLANRFDEARNIYEQILLEDSNNAEAHWGIILTKYGIEYIDDAKTGKKILTCHRTLVTSIFDDVDYIETIKNADSTTKPQYEKEAAEIAVIQKGIVERAANAEKYDVFICYKETDDISGERTPDSVIAQDLYYQLEKKGYKTFFARKSLENKLGSEYEPLIFSAISTAKVMVVIGTNPEYFNSVWLKNEWSRYLEFTEKDSNRILIPAYKGFSPYSLPNEFSSLQALDMEKIGFVQDLLDAIERVTRNSTDNAEVAPQAVNDPSLPLVERAYLFLEDRDWDKAVQYAERALDINPKCGNAYFCKFLVSIKCNSFNACIRNINRSKKFYNKNGDYQKAKRFADESLKKQIEQLETTELEITYNSAIDKIREKDYAGAIPILNSIKNYKDCNQLINNCRTKINEQQELYKKISENEQKIKALEQSKTVKQTEINNFQGRIAQAQAHTKENTFAVIIAAAVEIISFVCFFVFVLSSDTTTNADGTATLTITDFLALIFLLLSVVLYIGFTVLWARYKKKFLSQEISKIIVAIVLALVAPLIADVMAIVETIKIMTSKKNELFINKNESETTVASLNNELISINQQIRDLHVENQQFSIQLKEI